MVDIYKILNFISSNFGAIVLFLSLFGSLGALLVGKILYGLSIFQPLEELAHKQENYRRKHKLRKSNEKIARIRIELGNLLLDYNQFEAAKINFEKARNLDPMNDKAYMGLLKCEVFQPMLKTDPTFFDFEISKQKLMKILKENMHDKHANYLLGEIYRNTTYKKDPEVKKEALRCYNQVLNSGPKSDLDGFAYYGLAWFALTEAEDNKTLELMLAAENLCKNNPLFLNGLGYEYTIREDYEKAIDKLIRVLTFNPYMVIAYWNIISAYWMLNDLSNAYLYNKKLVDCIDDDNVFSLEINRRLYYIETDRKGNGEYFRNINEKKCYSYCIMALTCFLMGYVEDSKNYMNKAQSLSFINKTPAKKALNYYIECIQKKHENLIPELNIFRETFNFEL